MKKNILGALIFAVVFSLTALGQTNPAPSPTPNPPVRRRGLDQFGLSNGIKLPPPPRESSEPVKVEFVSPHDFEGITQMVTYAASVEAGYRKGMSQNVDANDRYSPEKVMRQKLTTTYRLLEVYRAGLLDYRQLKNPNNVAILEANQGIINDVMQALSVMQDKRAIDADLVRNLAVRYVGNEKSFDKQSLINAMLAQMNQNFARLKSQIAVAK